MKWIKTREGKNFLSREGASKKIKTCKLNFNSFTFFHQLQIFCSSDNKILINSGEKRWRIVRRKSFYGAVISSGSLEQDSVQIVEKGGEFTVVVLTVEYHL